MIWDLEALAWCATVALVVWFGIRFNRWVFDETNPGRPRIEVGPFDWAERCPEWRQASTIRRIHRHSGRWEGR